MEDVKWSCLGCLSPILLVYYVFVLLIYLFIHWSVVLLFFKLILYLWFCELVTFLAIATKYIICELIIRFPTSHLMNVMGICYLQYWFQGDAKENFNQYLLLIKVHYCCKKLLELVKTLKTGLPFVADKIYIIIIFVSVFNM